MLVPFIVPPLIVLIFPVEAVIVLNTAVNTFKTLAAKLPVTVTLLAVVEAIVELPETFKFAKYPVAKAAIFPRILVKVDDAKVDEPVVKKFAATSVPVFVDEPTLIFPATRLVTLELVEVEFVIVPLVAFTFVREILPAESVVIVALVIVELATVSPVMFAVAIFEVDA
jgi:hypothetical protein